MKISLKAVFLFLLIGLPVLVYLFLNFFGQNTFDLPYYFPKIEDNGNAILNSKGDTVYNKAPEFVLVDQDNKSYSSESLKGKTYLVNFFFSRCGTICPIINDNLNKVLKKVKMENLEAISITVDPNFDSPTVLKNYSSQFQNEKPWHFLTGDKQYIYNLAINNFKLPVANAETYDTTIKSIDDQFIHSEKVLLVDSLGFFRGIYDGTNLAEMDRLEMELDILNKNKNEKSEK